MESSSALTWFVVYASMIAEAFGTSSDEQAASGSSTFAAIGPLLLATLAVCIVAVVAVSVRSLRRPSSKPTDINDNTSTTIDVSLLAPPSLALDLDDDNILNFDEEEEEEDTKEKEEAKARRIGNLAQVMKNGRYFRSPAMEEFPYSPRHFRRTVASEAR